MNLEQIFVTDAYFFANCLTELSVWIIKHSIKWNINGRKCKLSVICLGLLIFVLQTTRTLMASTYMA